MWDCQGCTGLDFILEQVVQVKGESDSGMFLIEAILPSSYIIRWMGRCSTVKVIGLSCQPGVCRAGSPGSKEREDGCF